MTSIFVADDKCAQHRLQRTGSLHPPEGMQRDNWLDEPRKPRPADRR